MRNYIVGAFDSQSWADHGKKWLASATAHCGEAEILIYQNAMSDGSLAANKGRAEVRPFNGEYLSLLKDITKSEGVFLFAAPNVRFQSDLGPLFAEASSKFVMAPRRSLSNAFPYPGNTPVCENLWVAPSDLVDLLCRVCDMADSTDCKPPHLGRNLVSYFGDSFPWFRHLLASSICLPAMDADLVDKIYLEPSTRERVTVVLLDKPEEKRAAVLGGIVKPPKASLTSKPEVVSIVMPVDCVEEEVAS